MFIYLHRVQRRTHKKHKVMSKKQLKTSVGTDKSATTKNTKNVAKNAKNDAKIVETTENTDDVVDAVDETSVKTDESDAQNVETSVAPEISDELKKFIDDYNNAYRADNQQIRRTIERIFFVDFDEIAANTDVSIEFVVNDKSKTSVITDYKCTFGFKIVRKSLKINDVRPFHHALYRQTPIVTVRSMLLFIKNNLKFNIESLVGAHVNTTKHDHELKQFVDNMRKMNELQTTTKK